MTTAEFSNEFDLLWDNIDSGLLPGINDYEKSVFLTQAQEELVKNYFNPRGNKYGEGFDDTPKRDMDFSEIISIEDGILIAGETVDPRGKLFEVESDVFMPINEIIRAVDGENYTLLQVEAMEYEKYNAFMRKPYAQPPKRTVWRLIRENLSGLNPVFEVIPHSRDMNKTLEFKLRFVRRPAPIIISELEDDVTINGYSVQSECELNVVIHRDILNRAVDIAKKAYLGDVNAAQVLDQRSE